MLALSPYERSVRPNGRIGSVAAEQPIPSHRLLWCIARQKADEPLSATQAFVVIA
jgi:hypothetical protein